MARVLPDPLVGSFPPEVLKVHRALKAIPGEDFMVWVGLPLPGRGEHPHFLVVHDNSTAFVIAVAGVTESDLDENLHGSLFSGTMARPPSAAETCALLRQRVRTFIDTALARDVAGGSAVSGPPAVYGVVLFPQASHEKLRQLFGRNPLDDCYCLGEEHVTVDKLALCLRKLSTGGLEERQLARLRSHFSPETVVPPRLSTRAPRRRNVAAEYTPLLLDYDQEAWAKNRLHLSDEAAVVAETPSPYGEASLVTGVAGSGKSLVLLFRACTQAQLDPPSRTLVITHNRPLRRELEIRFGELGRPPNVEWHTFFSWVDTALPRPSSGMAQYGRRDALLAQAIQAQGGKATSQWVDFVRDEIDWMQDRAVTDLDDYLATDRIGRGVRLSPEQRRSLHAVYRCYRGLLAVKKQEDWSGRALRFWRDIERGKTQLTHYDYIYVDEAQFFAPVWLRALRRALKPGTGRLLLAADPTQGFLKRRQSWVACGLDIRGRSTRLHRSYRNTRPILALAADIYRSRMEDEEETDLNLPDEAELASAEPGEEPRIVPLTSRQDEAGRVINELKDYLAEGGDPEAVLVLVASGQRTAGVHDELTRALRPHRVCDARKTAVARAVRVCSIDAATGLEAPIVFVIGASELLEREEDLQLGPDQRMELRRDNTRRLYMAFTRAGQRLVITWVGALPSVWATHRRE